MKAVTSTLGFAALATVAACQADIAPGTYFCGPEQSCPEGQVCNGVDNICTVSASARPFACDLPDRTGDDSPATGLSLGKLDCVSVVHQLQACLVDGDPGDWFQFDVPDNCNGVQIDARLTYPTAFEPVAMQLSTDDGAPVDADTPCDDASGVSGGGNDVRCFVQTVANGSHLAIGLVHSGTADCDGTCAHNRYTLTLQLTAP